MDQGHEKTVRVALCSSGAGFVVWCALGIATHERWTTLGMEWGPQLEIVGFFLLAPLVLAPLGLALAGPGEGTGDLWRRAVWLQPPAAAGVFASFFLPVGDLAAALAVPWTLLGATLALCGLKGFASRGFSRWEETCFDAAFVNIAVGAGWLVASRAGMNPMGFKEPMIVLAAVHFHFAGFTTLVMAGMAGRRLRAWGRPAWAFYVPVAAAMILSIPLLMAGIATSAETRTVEVPTALLLAASVTAYALLVLFAIVPRLRRPVPVILLVLSSGSALLSMHYAVRFALGNWRGVAAVPLPRMITLHGFLNALGFTLCGGVAWALLGREEK